MRGNPTVIKNFQDALPLEAHLNLQYRMNARLLRFDGLKKLGNKFTGFADDAHSWLKAVTNQLLFLSGDGTGSPYQPAPVGQPGSVTAIITDSLAMVVQICDLYETNVVTASAAKDDLSRNLWEHLIKWHRDHQQWFEKQLRLIATLTEKDYIAEKL